jgi:hypothetical protein
VEDLLSDESFLLYCNHSSTEATEKWRNWIEFDPSHAALAEQALELFNDIREAEKQIVEIEIKQMDEERVSSALKVLMTRIEKIG